MLDPLAAAKRKETADDDAHTTLYIIYTQSNMDAIERTRNPVKRPRK